MRTVPLVVWFAQLLIACALHDDPLTTRGLEEVTANPQLSTGTPATKKHDNKQQTKEQATTAAPPAEEFLTQWAQPLTSTEQPPVTRLHVNATEALRSSTGTDNVSTAFGTSHYEVVNLGQTFSSKPASQTDKNNENPETGTRSGAFTTGLKTGDLTSQTDHTVQTSRKNWTEDNLGNKFEVTQSDKDIYNSTTGSQRVAAHTTATRVTTETEPDTEKQTSHGSSTVQTDTAPSSERDMDREVTTGYFITTPKAATVTRVTSSNGQNTSMHSTEGPLVSSTTSPQTDSSQEREEGMDNVTTTQRNTYNVTGSIWKDGWTQNTERLAQNFTTGSQGQIAEDGSTTQTTSANSTVGYMNAVHSRDSEVTTGHYITTSTTQATSSEGPLVSSPRANTASAASSENVTTTQRNTYNVTGSIWKDGWTQNTERHPQGSEASYNFTTGSQGQIAEDGNTTQTTSGNSTVGYINSVHSQDSEVTTGHYPVTASMTQATSSEGPLVSSTRANTTSSENITTTQSTGGHTSRTSTETTEKRHNDSVWSTSPVITPTSDSTEAVTTRNQSREGEWPVWPDCFNKASPSQWSSKRVCFITMWSLAMAASIFLGLTIFLWVRLSVDKKRARRRGRRDRGGKRSAGKEGQSLWATDGASAEERVEFWYTNGSTLEADKKGMVRGREERRTKRKGGKQKECKEEDMWMQPKVTLQDITEFWYANGRGRNEDAVDGQ